MTTTTTAMSQQSVADDVWYAESYPSGTQVVTNRSGGPWLTVYGPKPVGPVDDEGDDAQAIKNRYAMCDGLKEFLNGGKRPAWLADMRRTAEETLMGDDGSRIDATGPTCKDDEHPNGWRFRDDQAAQDMRARLVDRLTLNAAT